MYNKISVKMAWIPSVSTQSAHSAINANQNKNNKRRNTTKRQSLNVIRVAPMRQKLTVNRRKANKRHAMTKERSQKAITVKHSFVSYQSAVFATVKH